MQNILDDYVNVESFSGFFAVLSRHLFFTTFFSLSAGPDWSCFLGLYPLGFPRHCPVLVDILLIGLFDGGPFSPLGVGFPFIFLQMVFASFVDHSLLWGIGYFQSNNLGAQVSSYFVFNFKKFHQELVTAAWEQDKKLLAFSLNEHFTSILDLLVYLTLC